MTEPKRPLKIFLCHAHSDRDAVHALYTRLAKDGMDVWLDRENLLAGADWEFEIRKAVHEADVVVVCLSKQFNQGGFRQKEVRLALEVAMEKPEGEIFIIPARLEECDTLESLKKWNWVDLFEEDGYERLVRALRVRADKIEATLKIKRKNVINESEKSSFSFSPEHESSHGEAGNRNTSNNSKVAATWIVSIVTIMVVLVGLLSFYGKRFFTVPSPTPTAAVGIVFTETITPTQTPLNTVAPNEPTLTSMPSTDTPVPTITPVPPVAIGPDWLAGCISTLWSAYPASSLQEEKGNGCWQEPVYAFSAENGDLDFLAEREIGGSADIYGLFAPLPESGTVTFTVRLRDLENVDLWMGIFPEQDVYSQGLLMTILNGDVNRRSFVQKDPATYDTIQGTVALNQGNGYSISFVFTNLSVRSRVNPSVFMTNQVSIPTAQKWLFLGYKGLRGAYRIEGTFLNFELK
ncbi:MAG: toll/interleukin-1 receptor domain-containing protein [Chitinophagaceae bacterium]